MKITRYSKQCIKMAICQAIDKRIALEKKYAADYIKFNSKDKDKRNHDKDIFIYGCMASENAILEELDKVFSALEEINK